MKNLRNSILALSLLASGGVANAVALPATPIDVGNFALNAHRQLTNLNFPTIDDQLAASQKLFDGRAAFDKYVAALKESGNYGSIRKNLLVVSSSQSGTQAERLDGGVWNVTFQSEVKYTGAATVLTQCLEVVMRVQQRGGSDSTDFGLINSIAVDCKS